MSELTNIRNWLTGCPQMQNLFSIAAEDNDGDNLITPFSSSEKVGIDSVIDVTGALMADIIPFEMVHEDYQIDCFRRAYANQDDFNILTYDDVRAVCDWIEAQNTEKNYPDIGKQIVRVEPIPFLPQVRFKDMDTNIVGYFFTLRITYFNPMERQSAAYEY